MKNNIKDESFENYLDFFDDSIFLNNEEFEEDNVLNIDKDLHIIQEDDSFISSKELEEIIEEIENGYAKEIQKEIDKEDKNEKILEVNQLNTGFQFLITIDNFNNIFDLNLNQKEDVKIIYLYSENNRNYFYILNYNYVAYTKENFIHIKKIIDIDKDPKKYYNWIQNIIIGFQFNKIINKEGIDSAINFLNNVFKEEED